MKKSNLTVQVNEEELNALKMYLSKKDTSLEEEMAKAFEKLYARFVPALVRDYISEAKGEKDL